MPVTIDVVTDDTVLNVIRKADRPVPTLDVVTLLAIEHNVDEDQIAVTRLRRVLDRLEEKAELVASGGPKRDDIPGWSTGDKRDVLWATFNVANRIAEEVAAIERERIEAMERRTHLLKELHRQCTPDQRDALGITGLFHALKEDPTYSNGGATAWSLEVLEAVCELAGVE